ncbi:bcl-2-related ovarian killer protein homolog B-like isoform X2 [Harmonia axyridis]|nr:bcl-2-related ovarian killer protein homolog B-like isoform X2 [Harmonia axyridis]XP_045469922.1 bcl-2-related ovarian killer protein homolog B-like isoform X2 [Harmonia axyridis]
MDNDVISDQINKRLFETFNSRNKIGKRAFGGRKFSTPAALNTDRLQSAFIVNKRRFSNVGDVVSRKLSTTIGWRTSVAPSQEVILAGRTLCNMYIRNRLKRAGLFRRKIGLIRPQIMLGSSSIHENIAKEIFPYLLQSCLELERMYSNLYTNIARQLHCTEKMDEVAEIMVAVGHEIFRAEPTWGKVIAIFCVAGGLAVDSIKTGNAENVSRVADGMAELLEDRVAEWITSNGGWIHLCNRCRKEEDKEVVLFVGYSGIFMLIITILAISYFLMNSLLRYLL